jgi:hypothetical protein
MADLLKKHMTFKTLLWMVYASILAVITPHTKWMFAQLEPQANEWSAWVAAVGFEATIFVVTHLLVKHIERRKAGTFNFERQRLEKGTLGQYFTWWPVFRYRWLNTYTLLLFLACGISAGANLSHAVEFARPLKIVSDWGVPAGALTVAFGGILPLVNLLFAAVIADVDDSEQPADPALVKTREELREAKAALKEANSAAEKANAEKDQANARAIEAEQQMRGVANLMRFLFDRDMQLRDRIRGLAEARPDLSQNRIAGIIGCSTSTVNEALRDYILINQGQGAKVPEPAEV